MSHDKAMRYLDEFEKQKYGLIAFDEAHKLHNFGTTRVQRQRNPG